MSVRSDRPPPMRRSLLDRAAHREALWAWSVAVLTAVGAVIRFTSLGRQSFWLDETVTASLLERSFSGMLHALPASESTPPLYYVIAWGWSRVAGADEVGLRSLSAIAGTLTIPVAYAAATALATRRAGIATAALATVSPLLVWYSQEARSYALLVLFSALSFALFARSLERAKTATLAGWGAASALALLTHYFAAFLVIAEAALLLLAVRPRRPILLASGAVAVVGAVLLPLMARQSGGSAVWIRDVSLPLRVGETIRQLALPSPPPIWAGAGVSEDYLRSIWPLAVLVAALAIGVGLALGSRRERRGVCAALVVGGAIVACPLALAVAASLVGDGRGDFFLYRNVIVAWLPLTVAVAAGLTVRRAGWAGVVAAAFLVACSAAVLGLMWGDERFQRDDWRTIASEVRGPHRAIVLSPSWQEDGLLYHLPELGAVPAAGTEIDEIDVLVRRTAPAYTTLLERYLPPPPFMQVSRERIQHWTLMRFRSPSRVRMSFAVLAPGTRNTSQVIFAIRAQSR